MIKFFATLLCFYATLAVADKADFWTTPKRGANFFNETENSERIQAAKNYGIQFIRLAPNKWKTSSKDFLIGDADQFTSLQEDDLASLMKFLDLAQQQNMKVVVTTLSAPGSRWAQHNDNRYDKRLWQNLGFHYQMASFWKQLASRLKGHPAVVGYDVLNEPAPEKAANFPDWYQGDYEKWYKRVKGTAADLNLLYQTVIKAIREVDGETPVILETGFYATPWAIKYLAKVSDPNTLYSFHMYEPYAYTNYQQTGEYVYPGEAPIGEGDDPPSVFWDRQQLSKFFDPVKAWQTASNTPSTKILAGEFGVYRHHKGADLYLTDLVSLFKDTQWHSAFYSFREDTWPGMDYELGSQVLSQEWWDAFERGENPPRPYQKNPLFDAILEGIRQ